MSGDKLQKDREMILAAQAKGTGATLLTYMRLSGPGWLQSAITIGGGSLSNSLYLGVLVGFSCMWVQPLAMVLGVVMLGAIAYVTLSTGEPPLRAVNKYVSPVLGWGWLIGSMMANVVWSMPQYAISASALQQNLFPQIFGWGTQAGIFGRQENGTIAAVLLIFGIAVFNVMLYTRGGKAAKAFEIIIKIIIGLIVICFFGVIVKLSLTGTSGFAWSKVFLGMIPDFDIFTKPAPGLASEIAKVDAAFQGFWNNVVVTAQRGTMVGAAATAVGINMTFLLPYSMLRKGWSKEFRGLAVFDLATGLVIPFTIATGCVVMATAAQFHTVPAEGFLGEKNANGELVQPAENLIGSYNGLVDKRLSVKMSNEEKQAFIALPAAEKEKMRQSLPMADKRMAAMLVNRDTFNLAASLAPLLGAGLSKYIFGLGLVAMTLNAATMLMLINGLCVCELFGRPAQGKLQFFGSLIPSIGMLSALFWKKAAMWLAVPTSVFCAVLLPVAYVAFLLLMNKKSFMKENMPTGMVRFIWNVLMGLSVLATGALSLWVLWDKAAWVGVGFFIAFGVVAALVPMLRKKEAEPEKESA